MRFTRGFLSACTVDRRALGIIELFGDSFWETLEDVTLRNFSSDWEIVAFLGNPVMRALRGVHNLSEDGVQALASTPLWPQLRRLSVRSKSKKPLENALQLLQLIKEGPGGPRSIRFTFVARQRSGQRRELSLLMGFRVERGEQKPRIMLETKTEAWLVTWLERKLKKTWR